MHLRLCINELDKTFMILAKSVSLMLTRKAVNISTAIVLIGFGFVLTWLLTERSNDFIESHSARADLATRLAAFEIQEAIEKKRRHVRFFTSAYHKQIINLANNPEDENLHEDLNENIIRYFPDYFATNVMSSSGDLIIDDFDGEVGDLCIEDMRIHMATNDHPIRVHPNQHVYHYDIVSRISSNKENMLFFASFSLGSIAQLLKSSQPSQHELLLINNRMEYLIEITSRGGRDFIKNRDDYRLSKDEKKRIISSHPVHGTMWDVIDMHDINLIEDYNKTLLYQGLIIYIIFLIVTFYMRVSLLK